MSWRTVGKYIAAGLAFWVVLWASVLMVTTFLSENWRNAVHNFILLEYPHPFGDDIDYPRMLANHTALLVLGVAIGLGVAWLRQSDELKRLRAAHRMHREAHRETGGGVEGCPACFPEAPRR